MPGMDVTRSAVKCGQILLLAEIPILFLTAKIKDEDKIAGFERRGR
jgi:DNA-binding response OmpR family regulator